MNTKVSQLKSPYSAFSSCLQIIEWNQIQYGKYFSSLSYLVIYFMSTYASK